MNEHGVVCGNSWEIKFKTQQWIHRSLKWMEPKDICFNELVGFCVVRILIRAPETGEDGTVSQ